MTSDAEPRRWRHRAVAGGGADGSAGGGVDGSAGGGVDASAGGGDGGSAVVEFVFVAVVVMIPLVYLLAAVAVVLRSRIAVADAARDAGRAVVTATTHDDASVRVATAVRLAFASHGLPDDAVVRAVAAGAGCDSEPVRAEPTPGAEFTVCVTRHVRMPGVPSVVSGSSIACVGRYTVHVDDFRASEPAP